MAYYPKDAAAVQRLREQIEALGIPLVIMRKFIQLIGATRDFEKEGEQNETR